MGISNFSYVVFGIELNYSKLEEVVELGEEEKKDYEDLPTYLSECCRFPSYLDVDKNITIQTHSDYDGNPEKFIICTGKMPSASSDNLGLGGGVWKIPDFTDEQKN